MNEIKLEKVLQHVSCKDDNGKLRYDLVPPEWFEGLAEVMTYGTTKYQENSWQYVEVKSYIAALERHFQKWRKGEITDIGGSELNHLKHVAINALIILSLTTYNNDIPRK